MTIFSRMADIINSNLNALLDKAEDPEKMVRLIIKEMEDVLVEVRSTAARAIADRKELRRRQDWHGAEADEWQRKAEVAVEKGRDDLAKRALLERNRAREATESCDRELELIDETLAKLNGDISALQAKIKDAKAQQHAIAVRGRAAKTRLGVRRQLNDHDVDEAMRRFESFERKMDDIEGQVESYDLGRKTLADEIADLEKGDLIEDQLQELKAGLKSQQVRPTEAAGGQGQ